MNPTLIREPTFTASPVREPRRPPGLTVAAGAFYACMAGVHVGIVAADAQLYAGVADGSPWDFVRTGWSDVFMADPQLWGLAVAAGELALGVLLLLGGGLARAGWIGVILFQGLLVLFGWGYLVWSVPAALVLALGARHDWARLGTQRAD
jgi:hypothetical protein